MHILLWQFLNFKLRFISVIAFIILKLFNEILFRNAPNANKVYSIIYMEIFLKEAPVRMIRFFWSNLAKQKKEWHCIHFIRKKKKKKECAGGTIILYKKCKLCHLSASLIVWGYDFSQKHFSRLMEYLN